MTAFTGVNATSWRFDPVGYGGMTIVGVALLPTARGDPSALRIRGTAATLCGLLVDIVPFYNNIDTCSACRIYDGATTMAINPLVYGPAVFGGASHHFAGFVEVEFAGLGGDFAMYNGIHTLAAQGAADIEYRGTFFSGRPYVNWVAVPPNGPAWFITLYGGGLATCQSVWKLANPENDPEGVYALAWCNDGTCPDPTSCAASAGATCRLKWAGATWV